MKPSFNSVPFLIVLLLIFLVISCADEQFYTYPPHQPQYQGITLLSKDSNDFIIAIADGRIASLKLKIRSNSVVLSFYIYQENEFSETVETNSTGVNPLTNETVFRTSSDNDIIDAVKNAKQLGMNIVLNPILRNYNGKSTRYIPFSDNWFISYSSMIMKYATISGDYGVNVFCIGNELTSAVKEETLEHWTQLLQSVRSVYSNKVVYTASWMGIENFRNAEPELFWCPLFKHTDFVAFQAFPILTSNGQTHGTFWGSETNTLNSVRTYLEEFYRTTGKKFLIMQTGLQSQLGAELEPSIERDVQTSKRIPHEGIQELYYTYVIESLGKHPLCDGIFFWYWDAKIQEKDKLEGSFSPESKLASKVLLNWFSS